MSADEAKAYDGLQRLVIQQAKLESGVKKTKKAADRASRSISGMFKKSGSSMLKSVAELAIGWAGVSTAINLATKAHQKHEEQLQRSANRSKGFEDSLTELISLGDNYKNIKQIRNQVFSYASDIGLQPARVAQGMYTMHSNTGYLGNNKIKRQNLTKSSLMLSKFMNLDPTTSASILGKTGGFYKDASATQLSNMVAWAIESAAVEEGQELAPNIPNALQGAQAGGLTLAQGMGMLSFMTRKTGTSAVAAQAVKRIALRLNSRESALTRRIGFKKDDSSLLRLSKVKSYKEKHGLTIQQMKKLVGERSVPYLKVMLDDYNELSDTIKQANQAYSSTTDTVEYKRNYILANDEYQNAAHLSDQIAVADLKADHVAKNMHESNMRKLRTVHQKNKNKNNSRALHAVYGIQNAAANMFDSYLPGQSPLENYKNALVSGVRTAETRMLDNKPDTAYTNDLASSNNKQFEIFLDRINELNQRDTRLSEYKSKTEHMSDTQISKYLEKQISILDKLVIEFRKINAAKPVPHPQVQE